MHLNRGRLRQLAQVVGATTLALFFPVFVAAQTTFNGMGDGVSWEDPANWDNGLPSGNNTNINNGFTVSLSSPASIAELDISGDQGSTGGTLNHSAGALSGSGWLKIGLDGNLGTYNLSGTASAEGFSNAFFGTGGAGNGGQVSLSDDASFAAGEVVLSATSNLAVSGSASVNTGGDLRLEDNAVLNLSGGTVAPGQVFMRGSGQVVQSGGSLEANNWISIGNNSGDNSTYNISAGSLTSNGDWLTVGESGVGDLLVSGDAAVSGNGLGVIVGRNGGGVGTLEIAGSSASVAANDLRVGIDGDGNEGGAGTLSWLADAGGVSVIVSADNTDFGMNASLMVDLTGDANFDLFGTGGTLAEVLLIDNASAVSGTFAGLPEGASIDIGGGKSATLSYLGGDGFDVVLNVLVPEPATASLLALGALALAALGRRK